MATPADFFLDVRQLLEALAQLVSAILTLFTCSAVAFVCGFLAGRKLQKAVTDGDDEDSVVTPSTRRGVKR